MAIEPMKRISMFLPDDLKKRIVKASEVKKVSQGFIIRDCLDKYLEKLLED